jgi:hypothetical protein
VLEPIQVLDHIGVSTLGFEASAEVTVYLEALLAAGEKKGVARIEYLDQLLPVMPDGSRSPLYWIALLWLDNMDLIDHDHTEGGLEQFWLTETGIHVLSGLRYRRQKFS